MNRFMWLLVGFVALLSLLGVGLTLKPGEVPSPLIGKAAPAFSLPQLDYPDLTSSPESMRGKVWLLNVWASWCVACLQEHPVFVDLAKSGLVPIVGLNYKDPRKDALESPMATPNCSTYGRSNCSRQDRVDYDYSGLTAMRAAASLRR